MDGKHILGVRLTVEEVRTMLEVLCVFTKITKITPAKGKKKDDLMRTTEFCNELIVKLTDCLKCEEEKRGK